MTEQQYKEYELAAEFGTMPDDLNPIFIFSNIPNALLVKVVSGELDLIALAKIQLANRGYNAEGRHVGFKTNNK